MAVLQVDYFVAERVLDNLHLVHVDQSLAREQQLGVVLVVVNPVLGGDLVLGYYRFGADWPLTTGNEEGVKTKPVSTLQVSLQPFVPAGAWSKTSS